MSGGAGDQDAAALTALALDAAGDRCAVALAPAQGPVIELAETMARGHAERLFPLIEETLSTAGLTAQAVDVFVAARGPGSFTGVRLGVAAARALAMASGGRALGVDGFQAIAQEAWASGLRASRVMVLFGKAPRLLGRVFELGDAGPEARHGPEAFDLDAPPPRPFELAIGPGAVAFAAAGGAGAAPIDPRFQQIDIARLARLGAWLAQTGAAAPASPIYLRPPDAEPSREARPVRLGPRPSQRPHPGS